jgi:hypothetical protein
MNLAGAIVADEADILAIDAVNAGDLGVAAPARAIVTCDLVIDRFDIGRIREDAAGIVAGYRRTANSAPKASAAAVPPNAALTITASAIANFRTDF